MGRESILLLIALAMAITAAVWDIKQRRIPNWLTYPGIVLGIALRGLLLGGRVWAAQLRVVCWRAESCFSFSQYGPWERET